MHDLQTCDVFVLFFFADFKHFGVVTFRVPGPDDCHTTPDGLQLASLTEISCCFCFRAADSNIPSALGTRECNLLYLFKPTSIRH